MLDPIRSCRFGRFLKDTLTHYNSWVPRFPGRFSCSLKKNISGKGSSTIILLDSSCDYFFKVLLSCVSSIQESQETEHMFKILILEFKNCLKTKQKNQNQNPKQVLSLPAIVEKMTFSCTFRYTTYFNR